MKHRSAFLGAVLLAALANPQPAKATTWRVEKDGSGDFAVIQHAVDVAASGDTVLIGPGRFEEFVEYDSNRTLWKVCVLIRDLPELTIIGAGADQTIVTFEDGYDPGYWTGAVSYFPCDMLRVRGVGFGDFLRGVTTDGGLLFVENCAFNCEDLCGSAVNPGATDAASVLDSEVTGLWSAGVLSLSFGCNDLLVQRCRFVGCNSGVQAQSLSNPSVRVIDCEFEECVIAGVRIGDGSGGEVRGNVFRGNSRGGIELAESGSVLVVDNDVEIGGGAPLGIALYLMPHDGYPVTCTGNIFRSDQRCIFAPYPRDWSVHGNHILPLGGGVAVSCYIPGHSFPHDYPEVVHVDFTMNYWGTTDTEEIAAMIVDYHDYPEHEVIVDFEPMADGPVPVKRQTWSEMKALYR